MDRVIDILPHFQMAFAAACQRVIERMSQPRQLLLRGQRVRDVAQSLYNSRILASPDALAQGE